MSSTRRWFTRVKGKQLGWWGMPVCWHMRAVTTPMPEWQGKEVVPQDLKRAVQLLPCHGWAGRELGVITLTLIPFCLPTFCCDWWWPGRGYCHGCGRLRWVEGKLTGIGGAKSREARMCHPCGCQMSLRMVMIIEMKKTVSKIFKERSLWKGVSRWQPKKGRKCGK